jgi:uncharacterized glyoxalase superfamily protein PhnB
MTEAASTRYWQAMAVRDAEQMARWLSAIGFEEHATYRDGDDPTVVVHAEWLWPGGGGLMLGSARAGGALQETGRAAAYLVTDDPDAMMQRAVDAGATVDRPCVDQPYGGRGGSVLDPDGNHWSFGSYQPG